jgi:hypothetical protein
MCYLLAAPRKIILVNRGKSVKLDEVSIEAATLLGRETGLPPERVL